MDIVQIIEIVALVMGIPYMIFEVLQKNTMWYFGFFTSTACAIQFFLESNWANMGLNIYYVGMAFWGLYKWKKDSQAQYYQLQVSASSDFSTGVRTLKQMKAKALTIKNLVSGEYCYVRVRSVRKVGSSLWYGGWSKVKKCKIKKRRQRLCQSKKQREYSKDTLIRKQRKITKVPEASVITVRKKETA